MGESETASRECGGAIRMTPTMPAKASCSVPNIGEMGAVELKSKAATTVQTMSARQHRPGMRPVSYFEPLDVGLEVKAGEGPRVVPSLDDPKRFRHALRLRFQQFM